MKIEGRCDMRPSVLIGEKQIAFYQIKFCYFKIPAGQFFPGPMGTVPAGTAGCRRGLSPLAHLSIAPLGTGPVGTSGRQQLQTPMAGARKSIL